MHKHKWLACVSGDKFCHKCGKKYQTKPITTIRPNRGLFPDEVYQLVGLATLMALTAITIYFLVV